MLFAKIYVIGEVVENEETYGAYAHSDYGMITLLMTDGVAGLQVPQFIP